MSDFETQIKPVFDKVMGTFDEVTRKFQARNDKLEAKLEKVQAEMEEAKKSYNQAALQIAALELGGGAGHSRSNGQSLAHEQFNAILRDRQGESAARLSASEYQDYEKALDQYLRLGQAALDRSNIRNTLSVGSDPSGGFTVLPNLNPVPREKRFATNPMRAIAREVAITQGDNYEELADDGEFGAGYVGENDIRSETQEGMLAKLSAYLREPYVLINLTNRLIDLSSIDMVQYVVNRGDKKFRRLENRDFVSGNGITRPRGFLDHAGDATTQADEGEDPRPFDKLQYVASGQAGDFPMLSGVPGASDPSCLFRLRASLNAELRAGAVWVMNSQTEASLMSLRDGEGRWLFQQSILPDVPNMLLGKPIVIMESMPNIASNSHPIAFGDFSEGYLILDRPGVRVLRDPYSTKGRTTVFMYRYTGGAVWDFTAIKLLRMAAA